MDQASGKPKDECLICGPGVFGQLFEKERGGHWRVAVQDEKNWRRKDGSTPKFVFLALAPRSHCTYIYIQLWKELAMRLPVSGQCWSAKTRRSSASITPRLRQLARTGAHHHVGTHLWGIRAFHQRQSLRYCSDPLRFYLHMFLRNISRVMVTLLRRLYARYQNPLLTFRADALWRWADQYDLTAI